MTKISAQERKKNAELLRAFFTDIRRNTKYSKNANKTNKKKKKKKKPKSRKKRKKLRGGAVSLNIVTPQSQNVSASGAINQAMSKQKLNSANVVELNNAMAGGGGIAVPQMSQAGAGTNTLMKDVVDLQLNARAQSEFDGQALQGQSRGVAGQTGGKTRRKRRKRRRKNKIKETKRRKKRRKTKRRK